MLATCPADEDLMLMLEGALDQSKLASIEIHLDECRTCASVVANLAALGSGNPPDHAELVSIDPDNYVVIEEVARGGMGRILRARDRRLGREVALKENFVKTGDPARRFEREAKITARLQHPSIVQLHEAGKWPTGEPFFAMQLVSGKSLDKVIAQATTLDQRLALLPNALAVADAIAYAHSQGVIHRDLKPRNVIVGSFGETVVIDWGLAKDVSGKVPDVDAVDEPTGEGSGNDETEAGTVMGTPSYMPPEQALGQPVDERADVYALGAVLFHMLAGRPPVTGTSSDAVLAKVVAGEVPPLAEVQPGVPKDLLAIVGKAMAAEARDRYPSARELAHDLRRFQTGQLVSAHRYSRAQLLARWLRRHRTAVAITAVAATIVVAVGAISVQRIMRAERVADAERREAVQNRADAEELMSFMLGDLRDKLQPIGRLDLLDAVAKKATVYYQRRPLRTAEDRREHAIALGNLADVLLARGNTEDALADDRAALAETAAIAAAAPGDERLQRDLSIRHEHLGMALANRGDTEGALAEYRADLAIAEQLAASKPDDLSRQRDVSVSHEKVAEMLGMQGKLGEALAEQRTSLAISERIAKAMPTPNHDRDLGVGHERVGEALALHGEFAAALVEHRAALAIRERLAAHDPASADLQRDLSGSHNAIGELLLFGNQLADAIGEFRAALQVDEQLANRDPSNTDWTSDLAFGHYNLGRALHKQGDLAAALAEHRAALAIQDRLAARDPTHADRIRDVEVSHRAIGEILEARHDHAGARAELARFLELAQQLAQRDPLNATWQRDLAMAHEKLGYDHELVEEWDAAAGEYRTCLAIRAALAARDASNAEWQNDVGVAHYNLGEVLAKRDVRAALAEYRAALAITEQLLARDPDNEARKADRADNLAQIAALERRLNL
ncbi:MAG: protein kinase domain-containing protein [Acidobacteriota bacterium]